MTRLRIAPFLAAAALAGTASAAERPVVPSLQGKSDREIAQLSGDTRVEIGGRSLTLGQIRAEHASKLQSVRAQASAKNADAGARAAAELRRLRSEADAAHQKRLDDSKRLVAAEMAKARAGSGPGAVAVGDPHRPSDLETKAAALKRREAAARTAAEWLAIEKEARELLEKAR